MSTLLEIIKVIKDSNGVYQLPGDDDYEDLILSQELLYDIIVNEEEIENYLSASEIEIIRPNWGEVSLSSTNSLSTVKREKYLDLLKEVMKTNSRKKLDEFLAQEGIVSSELKDLKREPQLVLQIIQKIESNLSLEKFDLATSNKIRNEFKLFREFLVNRINANEYILMEFCD